MAQQQNKSSLLRILVPLIAVLVGLLVVISLGSGSGEPDGDDQANATTSSEQRAADTDADQPATEANNTATQTPGETDTQSETEETVTPDVADQPAEDPEAPPADPTDEDPEPSDTEPAEEAEPVGPLDNLRPAFTAAPASLDEPKNLIRLGSQDPATDFEVFADINPYRAGIHRVGITNEYQDVAKQNHYILLHPIDLSIGETRYPTVGSYAASYITINGKPVKLWQEDQDTGEWFGGWQVVSTSNSQAILTLTIQGGPDAAPLDIARIVRTFSIDADSHTVRLNQTVENLSDEPLTIRWEQFAQGDVHYETNDYLRGRSLHYVTAYFDDDFDNQRFSLYVKDGFISRPDLIAKLKDPNDTGKWKTVWPNPRVDPEDKALAWLASENRYFVAISSARVDKDLKDTADLTPLQDIYPTIKTTIYPDASSDPNLSDEKRSVLLSFISDELTLEPGKSTAPADLSLDLFVGPREDEIFAQPQYKALHFDKTIRYSLGGFCGFCTFQWLANILLGFLELLHAGIADWGVAIIILVLVVRLVLHPITKRGQINMMKMGKQMAAIQPEMEKLKKKYAEEPRQMQQAQMQLFREKGINPAAGALGCLPMFLQMPIWIALYAMLYYAIELRHEPAFYGVFQMIAGWPFLSDLSNADRFIPIMPDDGTTIFNLIFIQFNYSSINLLPILMGITFFINMKFTTPPPMNEQQATQQKIMKIMPLLFPFFLYSAPAGLTLYICASTMAGIIDSYIVRKHVKQLEESGELFKPKQHKPGGFMDRLHKAAEMRAQQMEEAKKQQQKNKGPQNYKKRKR